MRFGVMSLGDNRVDPLTGRLRTAVEHHREALELAVKAEALGFDSFHIGEHHGCDYITSTPSVLLGAAAALTERIRLSTATALLPIHEPLRFAEDYATVDVISNGRAEVIVSRGIIARSYPDFGCDYEKSRELFREKIQLVLQLWREEEVSWKGESRDPIDGYTVQPRPVQQPIPLWIGGGFTEDSVLLAAELGLPLMLPSVIRPPTDFVPLIEKYRESFKDQGLGGPVVGALSHTHCARDFETARARYGPRHADYLDWVGQRLFPWGFEPVLPPGSKLPSMPPVDLEQAMTEGPLVLGNPQQVLDRLASFKQACGLDRQLMHVDAGALPQADLFESLELIAAEVLPELEAA